MKLIRLLCICAMLLQTAGLCAEMSEDISALRLRAATDKNLKGYSAVCRYFYLAEERPDLLSLYADSIRMLGVRLKSVDCFIEYYVWQSEAYFMQGNFEQGYAWKRKSIVLAEKLKKNDYIAKCSSDMGYYFNIDARYDSARYYLKKGMEAGEDIPDLAAEYRTMLTNYASSFLYEGIVDSALVYTMLAGQRSAADKDTAMLIENLNQLGTIYRRKKNLEASVENYEKALRLCEAQNNFRVAAFIYGNLATVYSDWNRMEEAISFSEKAVEYAVKLGNSQMLAVCYINLGSILTNIPARMEEGIVTLLKAIPLLKETDNRRRLCEAYSFLVNAYQRTGRKEQAMSYLDKLDKLSDELKTDVERYRYYTVKAALLYSNKQYAEAIANYQRMAAMQKQGYLDAKDYECYNKLSFCYHKLNKEAAAYDCLREAYQLRDSSFHNNYDKQLSDFTAKYQTKEKELEIVRLQQVQLEQEAAMLRQRFIYGSVFALLAILVWVLLYARQRQKTRLAYLAYAVEEKERLFLQLQKDTEQRLTRKYIDGLESERQRMAIELHDDVCNDLLALEMSVRMLPSVQDDTITGSVKQLVAIRQRVRGLSHELMPPVFQYATIDEMLADYVTHLCLPATTQVNYLSTEEANWQEVPQEIGFEFYRIVQEAVNNAMKYASSSLIQVMLTLVDQQLSVQVIDNGQGFDVSKKSNGIGLRTIRQRANSVGAVVRLDSQIGSGVCVTVTVKV